MWENDYGEVFAVDERRQAEADLGDDGKHELNLGNRAWGHRRYREIGVPSTIFELYGFTPE